MNIPELLKSDGPHADEDWLHPFTDNTFQNQSEIMTEFIDSGYWPGMAAEWDGQHLEFCRRIAGGN